MCGACGTNGAGHWSAPFLASQAARSAAAKAVTAMTGRGVTVVGTPAGYVVGTPTGNRRAVADLGQVWNIVAPPGSPCRIGTAPVGLLGPATVPPLRAALTRVVLVVTRTGAFRGNATARMAQPEGDGEIDARQIGSAELPVRLRECADTQRSRVLRVLVDMADVDRLLAELPADPTRPFAVTDVLDRDDPKPTIPLYTDGSFQQLPGMLAWLAAHDGSTPHHNLRVQLPMPNRHILAIDLIRGLVTRCELQSNPVQLGSARNSASLLRQRHVVAQGRACRKSGIQQTRAGNRHLKAPSAFVTLVDSFWHKLPDVDEGVYWGGSDSLQAFSLGLRPDSGGPFEGWITEVLARQGRTSVRRAN